MAVPQKKSENPTPETIEAVIALGDLSKLTSNQRVELINAICKSNGLNPLTRPFRYLTLNGMLTLYATRDAADQLRKVNGISIEIVSQDVGDGLLSVHVRAKDQTGRADEDLGVVSFPDTLKGEARANTILKCVTKAKRRVTLSISGLGFLDETEVEDIPASAKRPVAAPNVMVAHDPETGEIKEPVAPKAIAEGTTETSPPEAQAPPPSGGALSIEDMARQAAQRGEALFRTFYRNRSGAEQMRINAIGDELRAIMQEVMNRETEDGSGTGNTENPNR